MNLNAYSEQSIFNKSKTYYIITKIKYIYVYMYKNISEWFENVYKLSKRTIVIRDYYNIHAQFALEINSYFKCV